MVAIGPQITPYGISQLIKRCKNFKHPDPGGQRGVTPTLSQDRYAMAKLARLGIVNLIFTGEEVSRLMVKKGILSYNEIPRSPMH